MSIFHKKKKNGKIRKAIRKAIRKVKPIFKEVGMTFESARLDMKKTGFKGKKVKKIKVFGITLNPNVKNLSRY